MISGSANSRGVIQVSKRTISKWCRERVGFFGFCLLACWSVSAANETLNGEHRAGHPPGDHAIPARKNGLSGPGPITHAVVPLGVTPRAAVLGPSPRGPGVPNSRGLDTQKEPQQTAAVGRTECLWEVPMGTQCEGAPSAGNLGAQGSNAGLP